MIPLYGAWFWCKKHKTAEFRPRKRASEAKLEGPYPTEELAEEFGQKVWGLSD